MIFARRYLKCIEPIPGHRGFIEVLWTVDGTPKPTIRLSMLDDLSQDQMKHVIVGLRKAAKIADEWVRREKLLARQNKQFASDVRIHCSIVSLG